MIALLIAALAGLLFAAIGSTTSPGMILIVVAMLGVAVLGMISPTLAFIFVAAVIPIERLGRFSDDSSIYMISLMRLAGLLAMLSFGVHALIKRWKLRFGSSLLLYGAYCLFAGLTLFYSKDLSQAYRLYGLVVGNVFFFFLVINVVRSWKLFNTVLLVWIASSVLMGMFTIYNWHFSGSVIAEKQIGTTSTRFSTMYNDLSEWESLGGVTRAFGPTSGPAVYGINMILTLPFLLYLIRFAKTNVSKVLWLSALAIILYNILLTNTRATIVGAIIALLLSGLHRLIPITPARVIAFCLIIILIIPIIPNTVIYRTLSYANYTYGQSATLRARIAFWKAWLNMAREYWLTGVGFGDLVTLSKYYDTSELPEQMSVHNHFLATFMELGIVGWLLFMGFLGSVFWTTRRAIRFFRERPAEQAQYWFLIASQVSFLTVLLYGLQCDVFYMPLKGWWLIAGLSQVLYMQINVSRVPEVQGL